LGARHLSPYQNRVSRRFGNIVNRFRLIEHTADIGLIAHGDSLPEAFANAAYGMFSIITDLDDVGEIESRRVEIALPSRRLQPIQPSPAAARSST